MMRVTLDAELRSKLGGLTQPVELCDEEGAVVAEIFPRVDVSEYEPIEPPFDEEELNRRERSNEPRFTTAEMLKFLETL